MADWNTGNDTWGGDQPSSDAWGGADAAATWNDGAQDGGAFDDGGNSGDMANDHAMGNGDGPGGDDKCFGCGETGHRRAECPNKAPIECHACKQPGHIARDCPDKPAMTCKNCGEEGHIQSACDKPRKISRDHVADVSPEDAWNKLKQATKERDVDDVKEALQEYVKALDGTPTFRDIQQGLIDEGVSLWFIGIERQLLGAFTNMDLQGNTGKTYTVSYRFSEKPTRPRDREGWPESRDAILDRLNDAGDTVDSGQQRCYNCNEWGHSSKNCPEPKMEKAEEESVCKNCKESGHRLRDCELMISNPNEALLTSHQAQSHALTSSRAETATGHMARDCPDGGGMTCRNCGQEGHMKKDCDQPLNMDNVTFRNCEQTGHMSKECPKPRDYSKVQCSNCQQYGHTKVRCKEPIAGETADGGGFENNQTYDSSWGQGTAAGGDYQPTSGNDGW